MARDDDVSGGVPYKKHPPRDVQEQSAVHPFPIVSSERVGFPIITLRNRLVPRQCFEHLFLIRLYFLPFGQPDNAYADVPLAKVSSVSVFLAWLYVS